MLPSRVVKRSIALEHHKTSVSMEPEFLDVLYAIAHERGLSLPKLISQIDLQREHANLACALRLFVLDYVKKKAAASGERCQPPTQRPSTQD